MIGTRVIAVGLLASQLFLLAFAAREVTDRRDMLAGATHTQAVVVRREEHRRGPGAAGGGDRVTHVIFYRFSTAEGREVLARFSSPFGFLAPKEGERLAVAYDPSDPERATPTSWGRMWFKVGLAGLIHVLMIILGLAMLIQGGEGRGPKPSVD